MCDFLVVLVVELITLNTGGRVWGDGHVIVHRNEKEFLIPAKKLTTIHFHPSRKSRRTTDSFPCTSQALATNERWRA